ncbi:hypothetical protein SBC2_76930 (plasmid) [Caballeronia sp. SBC2]|nr:hypothetical protein SBC2_76930 [Caballeronia sp. SBC2]
MSATTPVKRRTTEVERRVDDSKVGQRLRKIASKVLTSDVVFLGQQSKVIANSKYAFKLRSCLVGATL